MKKLRMKEEDKEAIDASPSQRHRKRRKRTIIRRRGNEKNLVIAPLSLPNDVVEEIFLRLPVKALIRLKCLSKQWKSTIESHCFLQRHLKIAEQSHVDHPKFMAISDEYPIKRVKGKGPRPNTYFGFNTICLESASLYSFTLINFPQEFHNWSYVSESCDGLFCIHFLKTQTVYVVNPATRWLRQLPPSRFQILVTKLNPTRDFSVYMRLVSYLAFVKASDDYKVVWLYNNSDDASEGLNKCEVFDFRANAWRYLTCTPSYRICYDKIPASAKGSLYWFTEPYDGEIKVVAFDIHTETFRVLPKINPAIASSTPKDIDMFTLDNSLCLWKRDRASLIQDIWKLRSLEDTWEKIFTIDLLPYSFSRTPFYNAFKWTLNDFVEPSTLMAICKNKKILLSHRYAHNLVKSISLLSQRPSLCGRYVSYFPSLISHI